MIKKTGLTAILLASLAACTSLHQAEKKIDATTGAVDAMRALNERNSISGAVIRTKRQRLAGREVIQDDVELPVWFNQRHEYASKGVQTIASALEDIASAAGISIKQSEIAASNQNGSPFNGIADKGNDPLSGNVAFEYAGTTKGLFDTLASKANVSWRYNPVTSSVEFFRYETRTLPMSIPAGAKTVTSGISLNGVSGGGGSGGGGGGSGGSGGSSTAGNVSVSQSKTIDPWKSVMDGINSMLQEGRATNSGMPTPNNQPSGNGAVLTASGAAGSVIANPDLGFITITARPATIERVARYVSTINARFAKNVHIDVKIYNVSLDEQSSLGFSLDMLYTQVGKMGGKIVGTSPLTAGNATPGILTLTSNKASGPWNGSTLVGQALSQFGKVSLQKQGQVIAVNGQPSPLQVANEVSYIASSSVAQAPNVGTVVTQTPGIKVVGFTANFTPLILGDNRILLSYEMQLSALAGSMTPNAAGTQTPTVASQTLQQNAFVKDGQAIVLFGFDDKTDAVDSNVNLGGASKAMRSQRQMLVIVMQVNTGERE